MTGEISGLSELLKTEQARRSRLQKRRKGLEVDLERAKRDAAKALAGARAEYEAEVDELKRQRDDFSSRVFALQDEVKKLKSEVLAEQAAFLSLKSVNDDLTGKLSALEVGRDELERLIAGFKNENDTLKSTLAAVPSREIVVADFRGSEEYKREIIEARVAAVESYKCSEEFDEEMRAATERGVSDFKMGAAYAEELARVQRTALSRLRGSAAFKEAVGVEAGKMSKQIVDCCREFFKGDLQRSTQEFGAFFVDFVRRHPSGGSSGQSSGVSGARSSTS